MEALCFHSFIPLFQNSILNLPCHSFNSRTPLHLISNSKPNSTIKCTDKTVGELPHPAHVVLGVDPNCAAAELKSSFRAKVKQFHPYVNGGNSNTMIRLVIQAYEMLSCYSESEIIERLIKMVCREDSEN